MQVEQPLRRRNREDGDGGAAERLDVAVGCGADDPERLPRPARGDADLVADRVLFLADGQIAKSLALPSQAEVIDAIQEVTGQ